MFASAHDNLESTHDMPVEERLQYLDLNLRLTDCRACWSYKTRGEKEVLRYDSCHSKVIKRGIAMAYIGQAVTKPCHHTLAESIKKQVGHLQTVPTLAVCWHKYMNRCCRKSGQTAKSTKKKREKKNKEASGSALRAWAITQAAQCHDVKVPPTK